MAFDGREFARVRNAVLLICAPAWILLLVQPAGMGIFTHCPATSSEVMPRTINTPTSVAIAWALMLIAMMSPALIPPIRHIHLRSFTHRRARSIFLFVTGYAAIWMGLCWAPLGIERIVTLFAPQSYPAAVCALLIALVWQFSPIKQLCLNRCHASPSLVAFGLAADFDAFRFGMTHGIWCAGSCWPLMLFPMLLPGGHVMAMAIVAILIFSERLEPPKPLRWRCRGFGKATRIVFAHARIRRESSLDSQVRGVRIARVPGQPSFSSRAV